MLNFDRLSQWYDYARDDWKQYRRSNPSNIYLISFPKSGVTWLRFMLAQILVKHYKIPLENPTIQLNELVSKYSELPRIVQTHEDSLLVNERGNRSNAQSLFIYGWRWRYRRNKVILLVRDPRDVVVSHYYQITKRSENPFEFSSLSQFVRHPIYGFERIIRFYEIWHRNHFIPQELLLIRYEDLLTNGFETLKKTLEFMDVQTVESTLIEQVYELSQADNMRKLELANQVEGMKLFENERNALKVRRAKIGTHQDELTLEDIKYCNQKMTHLPKIYGY